METQMAERSERIPVASFYELLRFLAEPMRAEQEKIVAQRSCAPSFSALAYFDNPEPKQTEIIASLLRPNGKHGQGTLFLRHFLKKIWPSVDVWSKSELQSAVIYTNHFIPRDIGADKRQRFIDLWIRVGNHCCLAVESKAQGAVDQQGQIRAYLDYVTKYMNGCGFPSGHYKVLYLSDKGESPSDGSITPTEWNCACSSGMAEAQRYTYFVREWLTECKKECKASRISFFIEDLTAFIDSDDRRTYAMAPDLDPTIHRLLFEEHPDDPAWEAKRNTLLRVWEMSDQIHREILGNFQREYCERLTQRAITYKFDDNDGLLGDRLWSGLIKGPQSEVIIGTESAIAYAAIQRCPPCKDHGTLRPHLIIGINIAGMGDGNHQADLKPLRQRVRMCGLEEGTGDKNWVWQKIPEGSQDLDSKDAAIKMLTTQFADEVVLELIDNWERFLECMTA
jgi:hypothetical protein